MFGKRQVLLKKIRVRKFSPLTSSTQKIRARKTDLRNKIKEEIQKRSFDLNKLGEKCNNKLLSVDVCFYLNNHTKIEGNYQKDLDNMMKIVCDVLAKQIIKNIRVTNVLLSIQDNLQYSSYYKAVYVSSLEKINGFLEDRREILSEKEVKKIVDNLKYYVTR